jgi:hypothetical protein
MHNRRLARVDILSNNSPVLCPEKEAKSVALLHRGLE